MLIHMLYELHSILMFINGFFSRYADVSFACVYQEIPQ
jgi:hypothetical protein